eukprot:m.42971 g.42971  ORF g.42971 m.42971 type:complete len:443 (-) comp5752_c0_seq3:175-1503(-)
MASTLAPMDTSEAVASKALCSLRIRTLAGQEFPLSADLTEDVDALKAKIASTLGSHASSFNLILGSKLIESGTLASAGVYDGARIDVSPHLQAGRVRSAIPASPADLSLETALHNIAALIPPAGLDGPISMEFTHDGNAITLTLGPAHPESADNNLETSSEKHNSHNAHLLPADSAQKLAALAPKIQDDDTDVTEAEREQYRALMQRMADRAREQAREDRQRANENKRVSSKMESLQARMRAKRAHTEAALRKTDTVLANGRPVPPAPAPVAPRSFGGLSKGFLARNSPASTISPAPLVTASNAGAAPTQPAPVVDVVKDFTAPTAPPAPVPATLPGPLVPPTPASSFGGLAKGFLARSSPAHASTPAPPAGRMLAPMTGISSASTALPFTALSGLHTTSSASTAAPTTCAPTPLPPAAPSPAQAASFGGLRKGFLLGRRGG